MQPQNPQTEKSTLLAEYWQAHFLFLEARQTGKRPVVNTQGNSLCSFAVGWARDKVSQADKSISQQSSKQQPEAQRMRN